jgi:xanthine/uracil permease
VVFCLLALKPRWWGKLLCAGIAGQWLFSGVALTLLRARFGGHGIEDVLPVLVPGVVIAAVGVFHQVIDPSFGRSR